MSRAPVRSFGWLLLFAAAPACIESSTPAGGDPESAAADAGAGGEPGSGGDAPFAGGSAAGGASGGEAGVPTGGGGAGGGTKPDQPPPGGSTDPDDPCPALCERIDTCFPEACPVLEAPPSEIGLCRLCADLAPEDARKLGAATCEDLNAFLFGARPDLVDACDMNRPGPVDPRCAPACDHLRACNLWPEGTNVPQDCEGLCAGMPPRLRDCLADNPACDVVAMCIGGGPGPGPEPPPDAAAQACENVCRRTTRCVEAACAPGTLEGDATEVCFEACLAAPPRPEDLRAFAESTCEDIVAQVRERDPRVDARCDASPEAACDTLCAERIVPCDAGLSPADCAALCEGFSEAQLRCVSDQACETVARCFEDPAVAERCDRVCDRVEDCLLEACPPRVIPPDLSDGCAADCLVDPPEGDEVEMIEAAACEDVRRLVYRNNRELAPICEGGGDFRPTAEECAAFCDTGLEACLGVGGRAFCLAGCASLTREQYACALAAQGECGAIDACLAAP
jgi:hypothetical protein